MLHFASHLSYLANVANLGTIFTVLLCLGSMIIFIRQFRLFEYEPTSVVHVERSITEESLVKINLPFSIKLGPITSTADGRALRIISTSFFPYLFVACKDVEINDLHILLNKPWLEFKKILEIDAKLWKNMIYQNQEEPHDQKSISLMCPTSDRLRVNYALVTYHLRIDEEYDSQEPVAVITVIHLPDDFCNSPAVTLSQFLKFQDNRLLNLKPLYSHENEKPAEIDGNPNCVICWSCPAICVLLPCRHACLCKNCLKRVENCPVCRAYVFSYFSV